MGLMNKLIDNFNGRETPHKYKDLPIETRVLVDELVAMMIALHQTKEPPCDE